MSKTDRGMSIGHLWQMADLGFPENARELLAYIERTNPEEIDVEAIKYIQSAAREILNNLANGKKPGADVALLLVCPQRKRQRIENERRNLGIALDFQLLKDEGMLVKVICSRLRELYHLGEDRIEGIWKEHKSVIAPAIESPSEKRALHSHRVGLEYHYLEKKGVDQEEILAQLGEKFDLRKDQIRAIWKIEEMLRKHEDEDL
ncbi:MAG: hypothetical protein ABW089_07440 [Sedimenticola sp.]